MCSHPCGCDFQEQEFYLRWWLRRAHGWFSIVSPMKEWLEHLCTQGMLKKYLLTGWHSSPKTLANPRPLPPYLWPFPPYPRSLPLYPRTLSYSITCHNLQDPEPLGSPALSLDVFNNRRKVGQAGILNIYYLKHIKFLFCEHRKPCSVFFNLPRISTSYMLLS